jgi:hypothetical protein
MTYSLVLENYQRESGRVLEATVRDATEDSPDLVGSFTAADAWHLHQFAIDAKQAAENVIEWAKLIDDAAHGLYLEVVREKRSEV